MNPLLSFETEPFEVDLEAELARRRRPSLPRQRFPTRPLRPPLRPRPKPPGRRPRPPFRRPWPSRSSVVVHPAWPAPPANEPAPAAGPDPGAGGTEFVRWVQDSLNRILDQQLTVDGRMTPETRQAIRDFQRRMGLLEDGIVGPETQQALVAERQKLAAGGQGTDPESGWHEARGAPTSEEWPEEISRSSPDYIRWVQSSLNQILGLRLAVDGIRGPQTRSAIRSFQQHQGLTVDGIVGPQTERALLDAGAGPPSRAAKPAPTGATCRFGFTPRPVESPGGGRITNKTPPHPSTLAQVQGVAGSIRLHPLAAEAWKSMVDAARAAGLQHPLLLPTSGFRDPEHQRRLWEQALQKYGSAAAARKWVAPPGSSPHQSGRAMDLYLGGKNSSENVANLRRLPAYRWLVQHAVCFGFYPYEAEPWHLEYNPPAPV